MCVSDLEEIIGLRILCNERNFAIYSITKYYLDGNN
jgi:hypothetical protein